MTLSTLLDSFRRIWRECGHVVEFQVQDNNVKLAIVKGFEGMRAGGEALETPLERSTHRADERIRFVKGRFIPINKSSFDSRK
ncbi:hypothetical protein [Paraburkholderia sp. RAU2J]|uniref:hypothetical protein n=1 Tax=Paraburkholderia sp. RAU2J TaxID=1938810 RepID=UPI0018F59BB6|nr:hypothetical protein [Paraburkholderia sp. RAU2J]